MSSEKPWMTSDSHDDWHNSLVTRRASIAIGIGAIVLAVASGAQPAASDSTRQTCVPKSAEIRFRAADGTRLVGYRLGRGKTAVVLAHERRSVGCQWGGYAKRLVRRGYVVLAFDFRGHGDSQSRAGRAGGRLAADVVAAVRVARARGAQKVFVLGASMGGTAALAAAATIKPPLAGVISASGPATYQWIDARAVVPRLTVPVLYVVGQHDGGGGFAADAQELFDATASADKRLEILPVSNHGVSLVTRNLTARGLVESFMARGTTRG
jgi:pimeloyl-ACP methyl ester carboxylesterase